MRMSKAALLASLFVLAAAGPATAELLISVDTATQQMTVTVDGAPIHSWPVSTGGPGYWTPEGTFRPSRLEVDHFSREWDNAPMPHSIFFTEKGHAIHGTRSARSLGAAVSHGCIRLATRNAATLFKLVQAHGLANTTVEVTSSWHAFRDTSDHNSFVDVGTPPEVMRILDVLGGR